MKKFTCVVLMMISLYVKAGSCSANGSGNWETPGTWSCGHVPGAGDDATIGTGLTVTVTANNTTNIGDFNIFGTLQFTNGAKINLATSSLVDVYSGGSITGGNGGAKLVFPSTSYSGSFSTTGPFFFSNGGSGTGVLPLTLVSFNSSRQNQEIILYWTTANEENMNSFEIESGSDGIADWRPLATIASMAASANGYAYTFIDHTNTDGDRYYRLKIIDRDGKYVYSKVLFIGSVHTGTISVTPTLVDQSMNIGLPTSDPARVSIYNVSGQLVKTLTAGTVAFNMDVSGLKRGEYFLQVTQEKNSHTAKFFKQ